MPQPSPPRPPPNPEPPERASERPPATQGAPLFVVFNIGSGHGDADTARGAIESACAAAGRRCELMVVDDPKRIPTLAQRAMEAARQAGGVVVAAGGDGTLNAVAQAVLGSGCAFGVLPQGTFNYFSRTHGIPSDTAAAMQVLLNEPAQPVQVGLVNGRVFLVNASVGLYPRLLEDREAWKQQLGRSRVVAFGAALATLLGVVRSLNLRVEANGQAHDLRTATLFVGNNALQMEQLGVPEALAIDAGSLAALVLRPVSRPTMLWLMLRGALGRLGDADQVLNFAFKRLTVRRQRGIGSRRVKVAVDGEILFAAMPLEFCVSREALWLIRPRTPAPERAAR